MEYVLKYCEVKEEPLHRELSVLLKQLKNQNVDIEVITAIEDIYIKKGILYCETAFELGYNAAVKDKIVNELTKS